MADPEIRAFLTIALMAALADGANDERERAALKSLAGRLGEGRIDLTDVYDDVLVRKISIADAVRPLTTTETRRQAYETAVTVAAADGVTSPKEGAFLPISPRRSACPRRTRRVTWRKLMRSRQPQVSPVRAVPSRSARCRGT